MADGGRRRLMVFRSRSLPDENKIRASLILLRDEADRRRARSHRPRNMKSPRAFTHSAMVFARAADSRGSYGPQLLADDPGQALVVDDLDLVGYRDEAAVDPVEIAPRKLMPHLFALPRERVPPRMLAQHEAAVGHADRLRGHYLVGQAILYDPILVYARFVREGVPPNDGLIRLHLDARHLGEQPARRVELLRADRGRVRHNVLPYAQGHDYLFERRVPRALAYAVDRAFHLPRPSLDGRYRVGHGEPQIVVAVHGDGRFAYTRHARANPSDDPGEFARSGVAYRVGYVDHASPGFDHRLDHRAKKVEIGPGRVFRRKLDILAQPPREGDRLARLIERPVARDPQLVLQVDVGGRKKCVDARPRGRLERQPGPFDVFSRRAREPGDDRPSYLPRDRLHGLEIALARDGKARLDNVDPEP